jgi:hypothetical protein
MHFTFCLDGGSVFFMAAKAEVLEKQSSPSAAQRSADFAMPCDGTASRGWIPLL